MTLVVPPYNCTSATCYTETGFTYCYVTVLHYNSTMSTCSQVEGSLSISTALLQNNTADKNKKFSTFYYKPQICYLIHITLIAPFWASWIRSTFSHSISCNPVLIFHLHTVNWRVQSVTSHTFIIPPIGATQWRTEGGGFEGVQPPPKFRRPSKIVPKSTRLWKLLKIAEFRTPTPQDVRKYGTKILKLPRFATVLH